MGKRRILGGLKDVKRHCNDDVPPAKRQEFKCSSKFFPTSASVLLTLSLSLSLLLSSYLKVFPLSSQNNDNPFHNKTWCNE